MTTDQPTNELATDADIDARTTDALSDRAAAAEPAAAEHAVAEHAAAERAPAAADLSTTEAVETAFRERGYITDRSLSTAVFLALQLGRPLLLEGEAGVGKTELAKVLAASLGAKLIRLQCYEGLDVNTAVYEWNYPRQMLEIRLLEARGAADGRRAHDIFGPEFLIKRPLLQALESTRRRRRRCCSSTRSTGRTRSSRRTSSRSCPTSRSPCPRSARSRPSGRRA